MAAALLTASVVTGPAWALGSPAAAEAPTDPKDLQDSLRQALKDLQTSQLSQARVSPQGMRVFQQAMERGLAAVPIETLVSVQVTMQLSLPLSEQEQQQETWPGQANVMILFNSPAISSLFADICRQSLPRISAADRARARPVCDQSPMVGTNAQP